MSQDEASLSALSTMAEPPATPPDELVRQLERYAALPGTPDQLVQLLRPPRLGLRSTPTLRCASSFSRILKVELTRKRYRRDYGGSAEFWPTLARVWQVESGRLEQDEKDSIPAVTALAAFLLSLCTQDSENQKSAMCVSHNLTSEATLISFFAEHTSSRTCAAFS